MFCKNSFVIHINTELRPLMFKNPISIGKKILNIPCIGSTDCKLCIHGVESGRQNFDGYWLIVTIFDVIEHILKLGVRSVPSHAWRSWVSWAMPWKWMKKTDVFSITMIDIADISHYVLSIYNCLKYLCQCMDTYG